MHRQLLVGLLFGVIPLAALQLHAAAAREEGERPGETGRCRQNATTGARLALAAPRGGRHFAVGRLQTAAAGPARSRTYRGDELTRMSH
jgi:hypothetical protein